MLLLHYPSWTSSRKAKKWLDETGVSYELRLIHKDNPKADEVKKWMDISGLELKKFFNVNGKVFKEMNLKEKWDSLTEEELLKILESDGMIAKRPVLVGDDFVLTGFKQGDWEEKTQLKVENK